MHDHHQPLPFIKGVKNKQGIVLAEHSDPLLPIPMNGIAGLDMALACKADKVAFVTKLTVEDEVITFTGLDHIKDSFACLIKIKSGGNWLGAIFATKTIDGDCTQFIQTLTDYYIRTYADGEWGEWAKHTIGEGGGIELPITISDVTGLQAALDGKASTDDLHGLESIVQGLEDSKADVEHTQAISTITGLQAALDGKLDGNITKMSATAETPIVVTDLPVGKLVLIDNSGTLIETKLSQLIVAGGYVFDKLHFHLNSGDLINKFFLVRRFTWTGGTPIMNHNFIEVVGAWD